MFKPEETAIYGYQVEGIDRYADPLDITRRIRQFAGESLDILWQKIQKLRPVGDVEPTQMDFEIGYDAENRLVNAVSQAFEIPPFETATGKGYTREQIISLWNHFQDWQQKKNGSTMS